jgi:hypothetical protein
MAMTIIRHTLTLGMVLCLSVARSLAQDQEGDRIARVLAAGDPEMEAVARHRLSADNLRRMFAVDRELRALRKTLPDLETRSNELQERIDPGRRLGVVESGARLHEGIPEIAAILRKHNISGREYMLTHTVAMVTATTEDVPDMPQTQSMRFWKSMDAALKAEAAEWKKLQGYDKPFMR